MSEYFRSEVVYHSSKFTHFAATSVFKGMLRNYVAKTFPFDKTGAHCNKLLVDTKDFTAHNLLNGWFESVLFIKMAVFWDFAQRSVINTNPDNDGGMFLWNVRQNLPNHTAQHPETQPYLYLSSWKPEISQHYLNFNIATE